MLQDLLFFTLGSNKALTIRKDLRGNTEHKIVPGTNKTSTKTI